MAEFVTIDPIGGLVANGLPPYLKGFSVGPATGLTRNPRIAYLLLTVYTNYRNLTDRAAVNVNGRTVGVIPVQPVNPGPDLNGLTEIFIIPGPLLVVNAVNRLEIVRKGQVNDPNNYLIVGTAICHFRF